MNLQRMKFAWARGARMQLLFPTAPEPTWILANRKGFIWHEAYEIRIHPDDEHLQYGPVSTAFRDMALYTDIADLPEIVELFMDMVGSVWVLGAHTTSAIEADFCRLFFAEYLADEGL